MREMSPEQQPFKLTSKCPRWPRPLRQISATKRAEKRPRRTNGGVLAVQAGSVIRAADFGH